MNTFSKNLQKFLVYSFTGVSVLLVVLGISRVKKTELVAQTAPEQSSLSKGPTTLGGEKLAILGSIETAFKGKMYQTPWGDVVAQIQIKDGKVVGVTIPTLPDSPPSTQAEPYLIAQALRSGNSNIQGVSGATITSRAFKASLESALAQAANAAPSAVAFDARTQVSTPEQSPVTSATTAQQSSAPTEPKTSSVATKTTAGVSGTFKGSAYQTPWGNAVASISVANGKITGVTMPEVPQSPPSIYAEPYLVQQALAAGSANIQGVSGATYTSIAFKSSLESAISLANTTAGAQGTATIATSPSTSVSTPAKNTQTSYPRRYQRYNDDGWDD